MNAKCPVCGKLLITVSKSALDAGRIPGLDAVKGEAGGLLAKGYCLDFHVCGSKPMISRRVRFEPCGECISEVFDPCPNHEDSHPTDQPC